VLAATGRQPQQGVEVERGEQLAAQRFLRQLLGVLVHVDAKSRSTLLPATNLATSRRESDTGTTVQQSKPRRVSIDAVATEERQSLRHGTRGDPSVRGMSRVLEAMSGTPAAHGQVGERIDHFPISRDGVRSPRRAARSGAM
jgi:hypothetical protein